jgi:hypothetical protein
MIHLQVAPKTCELSAHRGEDIVKTHVKFYSFISGNRSNQHFTGRDVT